VSSVAETISEVLSPLEEELGYLHYTKDLIVVPGVAYFRRLSTFYEVFVAEDES
jgi:hypothetical protein